MCKAHQQWLHFVALPARMKPHTEALWGPAWHFQHIPTVNILHLIHGVAAYTFHLNIIIFGNEKLVLKNPYRTAWKRVDEILVTAHKMVCFDVTFMAILLKHISIKSSMSLPFQPKWKHTPVSALFSLSSQQSQQQWGQRRITDGKWSQVRRWRHSSCRTNSTKKQPCQMVAPWKKDWEIRNW